MLPYLFILSCVIFWIVLEKKAIGRKSFWVPLIALALFAGIRSHRVGTDSWSYTRKFRYELPIENYEFNDFVELGYQVLEYFLLSITHNYFWLFFLTALLVVGCHLLIAKKYSLDYPLSIIIFFTLGSYIFFFNGLRQGLAMAIITLATPYFLEKKLYKFLMVIVVASLFHKSALLMIPIYFLANLNISSFYKILISFIASLIISRVVIVELAATNYRYETYTQESEDPGGFMILGFYVAIGLLLYIIKYFYKIEDKIYSKLLVFYAIGIAFMIPIAMLKTNPSGPQRLIYYFTWALILLIPISLKYINNKLVYVTSIALAVVFFILTTSKFGNLTPYMINPIFEMI